jgi:hypothetical protein
MKDYDYNMKLMSTYGRLIPKDGAPDKQRLVDGQIKTIKYCEPFGNRYKFWHCVDDHNNNRHLDISLEDTWATHTWENRVFAFIFGITEVNAFLSWKHFCKGDSNMTLLEFRRKLSQELIGNTLDPQEVDEEETPRRSKQKRVVQVHTLELAPPHGQQFSNGKWVGRTKQRYQQFTCKSKGCTKKIRTYCSCDPGFWMCTACHNNHIIEMAMAD